MKGLIFKDFLYLKKQGLMFLLIVFTFTVISIANNNPSFILGFLTIFSVTLVFNAFSYDEFYKWDLLARALPVTQKQIVLARYTYSLIFIGGSALLGVLICLVQRQWTAEAKLILGVGFSMAMLIMSLLIPLLYKFGSQKGRMLMMLLFFVPFLAIMFLSRFGLESIHLNALTQDAVGSIAVTLLILAAVLFFLSYFVSLRIYVRKEV